MGTNGLATADDLRAVGGKVVRRFKDLEPLPITKVLVRIQSMTEGEMSKWQMAVHGTRGQTVRARMEDAERRLFVHCMVDADGNQLLAKGETDIFVDWDAVDTATLYNECAGWCGINRDDIEALIKNSSATTAES